MKTAVAPIADKWNRFMGIEQVPKGKANLKLHHWKV